MLRHTKKTRDPDLEKSKKEREDALGVVRNAQAETSQIIEVKKKLESDIETRKQTIENEFKKLEDELQLNVDSLNSEIAQKEKVLEEINDNLTKASKAYVIIQDSIALLTTDEKKLTESKEKITSEISILDESKTKLDTEIKEKNDLIETLTERKESIGNQIVKLRDVLTQIENTVNIENRKMIDVIEEVSTSTKLKNKNEETSLNLIADIKIKKEELKTINMAIEKSKSEASDLELKRIQTDKETAEKIGNLAQLEQRVDQKMEILKKYKEKFSVDELAKMKIKTDVI